MTGQVKSNRNYKTRRDGLLKEERQKRYDNKACLGCGKQGHFVNKCPDKKIATKSVKKDTEEIVKTAMIRCPTPYVPDEDVSDMDLYEEARVEVPNELQD